MLISKKIVESQLIFFNLKYNDSILDELSFKLQTRVKHTKHIYKNLLQSFFLFIKIVRLIFFVVPSKKFYKYVFLIFGKLPSPLDLVTKLVRGYILLDFFENEKI